MIDTNKECVVYEQNCIKGFCTKSAFELRFENAKCDTPSAVFFDMASAIVGSSKYDWKNKVSLKLQSTEVFGLSSVFLGISDIFQPTNRKTSHLNNPAYKNLKVEINPVFPDSLLVTLGVVHINDSDKVKNFILSCPVDGLLNTEIGLFLISCIIRLNPLISSESVITSLRLAEARKRTTIAKK